MRYLAKFGVVYLGIDNKLCIGEDGAVTNFFIGADDLKGLMGAGRLQFDQISLFSGGPSLRNAAFDGAVDAQVSLFSLLID